MNAATGGATQRLQRTQTDLAAVEVHNAVAVHADGQLAQQRGLLGNPDSVQLDRQRTTRGGDQGRGDTVMRAVAQILR